MANGILSLLRGMVGSSDGTATGTPSVWKVASGVGSVVSTTADALLTTIAARLLSSANVSAADLLGFVRTAAEKVATEVAVGDGLAVRQATASKLNARVVDGSGNALATQATVATLATQATLATIDADTGDIKTAVEKMDDWDAVHDAAAGTDGVRLMGTAYADPSTLPADVSADGDDARVATDRKGVGYARMIGVDGGGVRRDVLCDTAGKAAVYDTPAYLQSVGAEVDPINAGGVYLTGWVDVRNYPIVGVYVHNTGANPITTVYVYHSPDGVDAGVGAGIAVTIAAGSGQMIYPSPANSSSVVNPMCPSGYIRIVAASAAGSKGRATIVGKR